MGTNGPPSMSTRSRCAAAAVTVLVATPPTNAKLWNPRSFKTKSEKLYTVLEGDKPINYRQLINYAKLGEQ